MIDGLLKIYLTQLKSLVYHEFLHKCQILQKARMEIILCNVKISIVMSIINMNINKAIINIPKKNEEINMFRRQFSLSNEGTSPSDKKLVSSNFAHK